MSGKRWIEHLCLQLDINAVEMHDLMLDANKDAKQVHTSTLRKHLTAESIPDDKLQQVVRMAVARLHGANGRKPQWNNEIHSYAAFKNGHIPVPAPLAINTPIPQTDKTKAYAGSYTVLRKNYSGNIVAEFLQLDLKADRTGTFDITLFMREGGMGEQAGTELLKFQGNAHPTITSIWGYGVRISAQKNHECLSFSIARAANDHPQYLAGVILRRSSIDRAPVGQAIYLRRLKKPPASTARDAYLAAVQHHVQGIKGLSKKFNEIRSKADSAQAVFDRLPSKLTI